MPFFIMSVSYLDKPGNDGSSISSIDEITALRWHHGSAGSVLSLQNINQLSTEQLSEKVVPLLQLAEGCIFVGPATLDDLMAVQDLCESLGYHLPVADPTLDVAQLTGLFDDGGVDGSFGSKPEDSHWTFGSNITDFLPALDRLAEQTASLPVVTLQHLATLGHMISHGLGQWFEDFANLLLQSGAKPLPDHVEVIDQLAFSKPPVRQGNRPARYGDTPDWSEAEESATGDAGDTGSQDAVDESKTVENPTHYLEEGSPFAARLPGFQVRPGQLQMVDAVAAALSSSHHLMVEAGTGTGKSLAYLIPAALHAKTTKERVIVSTHTIALQDQISNRDFPMLQQSLGTPVTLAVFKGRTHYICMRKLHQELRSVSLLTPPEEIFTSMRLLVWLTTTPEGNREELSSLPGLYSVWPRIQSETETCISKRCPFFKPCFYFRARARAHDADVVVTNHSLVFTDLKADHRVLPHYEHLIFDEAHHLEQEATNHLGSEVGRFQLLGLLGRLTRDSGRHGVISDLMTRLVGSDAVSIKAIPVLESLGDELSSLRTLAEEAFANLAQLVPQGQSDIRITEQVVKSSRFLEVIRIAEALQERASNLEELRGTLSDFAEKEPDEDLAGRLFDATGFLAELGGRTQLLAGVGGQSPDWVEWVEVSGSPERRQVVLHQAPIDVSKILRERLFDAKESVVLTSATLSVAGDFSFLEQRIGLAGLDKTETQPDFEVHSLTVPTPFDYSRQALLCVPTDVPDLSKMSAEEASVWLSDSIYQLARISGGRLLTLFTSHAMLRATAEYLRRPLRDKGLQLLAQGLDGSRTQLLRMFQEQPRSVLLGAQSFWEGIDLPGDQLTTLCIVRLPFTPPTHPVTAARNELTEAAGKSAFVHNSLPEAVVRFRQGFGRLIRTTRDKGVVVVFDKRIVTARYGQQFIKSVPGLQTFVGPELEVLRTVKSFLA